jgi:regulator of sirC expression with transglutaminase-like and TPR domain
MTAAAAREQLERWVRNPPEQWPLAEAALLLSVDDYPALDLEGHLLYLEHLAGRVLVRLPMGERPAADGIAALHRVIFEEEGFSGNIEQYNDPRNGCLNEVLERRTGLPIALSVIVIEVARRASLPVSGVGFPSHFLVRYEDADTPHFLDPFHRGTECPRDELRRLWDRAMAGAPWDEEILAPLPDDRILVRMLNNLKRMYAECKEFGRSIAAAEKLVILEPSVASHQRDLGYLHAVNREIGKAISCLDRYLQLAPKAADAPQVREHLRLINASVARWN